MLALELIKDRAADSAVIAASGTSADRYRFGLFHSRCREQDLARAGKPSDF
jgi:hypothetical protein